MQYICAVYHEKSGKGVVENTKGLLKTLEGERAVLAFSLDVWYSEKNAG
jgi:hypothetical protein